ncbi:MAG: DMP19 family protein [Dysgonamonadaceae bacterium]|jgi:hypothetical protein|nr:DMP19 family protein [Dysgonamonadaceae bacterium]
MKSKTFNDLIIMSLIGSVFSFLSCLNKNSSEDKYLNIPVYKYLTVEIIDSLPDENFLLIINNQLQRKLPEDYKKEFEIVMSWNKSQQAIYMIWWLEAEVNNGGFNQFYENSSGQYAEYLPDALRLIGAVKFADLVERANKVYLENYEQITKEIDGTLEGFSKSYEDNPLNEFDAEFYKYEEPLYDLQVKYIKAHKQDFIDK